MTIRFLELAEVLEIHRDQIRRHGGRHGVRSADLLQSALAVPRAGAGDEYFHGDLVEMAAAYLFHVVRNHPFVDGNKRVAFAMAFLFLKLNGVSLPSERREMADVVLEVAEGRLGKTVLAARMRAWVDG